MGCLTLDFVEQIVWSIQWSSVLENLLFINFFMATTQTWLPTNFLGNGHLILVAGGGASWKFGHPLHEPIFYKFNYFHENSLLIIILKNKNVCKWGINTKLTPSPHTEQNSTYAFLGKKKPEHPPPILLASTHSVLNGFSRPTVFRILKLYRETWNASKRHIPRQLSCKYSDLYISNRLIHVRRC